MSGTIRIVDKLRKCGLFLGNQCHPRERSGAEAGKTELCLNSSPTKSAYVDQPCEIGPGTKIWHFCHIMKGATIGAQCSLGQNVVVSSTSRLGAHVKVQNNVSIYDGVTLEDDVFCGPSMVFTNVLNPRSEIVPKASTAPPWCGGGRAWRPIVHRVRAYRGPLRLRGGRGRGHAGCARLLPGGGGARRAHRLDVPLRTAQLEWSSTRGHAAPPADAHRLCGGRVEPCEP